MGKLTILVFSIFLIGCCKPTIKTEYVKVYINVPVVPTKPPIYEKVDLPIFHLAKKAEPKDISEAYYNSVIILLGEVNKRDTDLDVYRNFEIKKEGDNK